jgi:hypothetical protein
MIPMTRAKAVRISGLGVIVVGMALAIIMSLGGVAPKAAKTAHIGNGATRRTITPTPVQTVDGAQSHRAAKAAPAADAEAAVPAATPSAVVVAAPVIVPKPVVAPPVVGPPVATLIAEVEATGMEPGSNWTWTMGDTATHCGVITGAGTGCTYGADGLEYSIFAGSPTLALVAHELANAETQDDAVPSLLNEVAAAAGTTSWSPTDAVASCLVEHFMGFQDNSAGSWQCPAALATIVADNIHDTA